MIEPDDVTLPLDTDSPWQLEEVIVSDFWESVARPYAERLSVSVPWLGMEDAEQAHRFGRLLEHTAQL